MRLRVAPLAAAGLVLLGGLNVGLLAAVLAQIAPGDQPAKENTEWIPQAGRSVEPVATRKSIESYKLTLAHPVFFKTREPFVPRPPPPPPPKVVQPAAPVVVDPGLILGAS